LLGPAIERKNAGVIVRRSFILGTSFVIALAGTTAVVNCTNNQNPAILPITAVDIDISDLLSSANLGCGEGDFDVFEYATVVGLKDLDGGDPTGEGSSSCPADTIKAAPVFSGSSPCFANAVFSNLPGLPDGGALPDGGSVIYSVNVYFYNHKTFEKVKGKIAEATNPDAGETNPDGGENVTTSLCDIPATWMATCTADEQSNIPVNASCGRIGAAADAPVPDSGAGAADAKPDARTKDATGENALDAPMDAPLDDDADAGAIDDATTG
jgi:hypothetical protein